MEINFEIINTFIKQRKYCSYGNICASLLKDDKPYSLLQRRMWKDPAYLPANIEECVRLYTKSKDQAVSMFRDFVDYLNTIGFSVQMDFPQVSLSSSFERVIFIAKYFHNSDASVEGLKNILWVSERTIEEDLARLRGLKDPISVAGNTFFLEDCKRENGTVQMKSTLHPLFLTENLTQVIIMLKGLRAMEKNPLYSEYAKMTAKEIWSQLSAYAKKRIHYVLSELLSDDISWYESLEGSMDNMFHSERTCSTNRYSGAGHLLMCFKNEERFCIEYDTGSDKVIYRDCLCVPRSYDGSSIKIETNGEQIRIELDKVCKSASCIELLL